MQQDQFKIDATLRYIDRYTQSQGNSKKDNQTTFAGYETVHSANERFPLPPLPAHLHYKRKVEQNEGRERLNQVKTFRRGWKI